MARAEDGRRRHTPVPVDAWSLWMVARPAASATPARCYGPGDRRRDRADHETHHRTRKTESRCGLKNNDPRTGRKRSHGLRRHIVAAAPRRYDRARLLA